MTSEFRNLLDRLLGLLFSSDGRAEDFGWRQGLTVNQAKPGIGDLRIIIRAQNAQPLEDIAAGYQRVLIRFERHLRPSKAVSVLRDPLRDCRRSALGGSVYYAVRRRFDHSQGQ